MDDPTHIAAILAALANGDDPFTGLPLPAGHALTDVRVKAALAAAAARIDPEMRLDQVSWREPDAPRPEPSSSDEEGRQGKAWTPDEQAILVAGHDAGIGHTAQAARLGRTAGAVRSRLVYLGLLTVSSAKADVRFLHHFEHGHLLTRCLDDAAVHRAARLLAETDPAGAEARLSAALSLYAARDDASPSGWDARGVLAGLDAR